MKTVLKDFYPVGKEVDGSRDLHPIILPIVDKEVYDYRTSDLEHFDKVFDKDSLPTYHQMMDNAIHWIWNEYNNDPEKWDSDEYHEKILDKVFAFVNARILGIINPAPNHDRIVKILTDNFPGIDVIGMIQKKYRELKDRDTPFTKSDALVWYELDIPVSICRYTPKPIIVPHLIVNDKYYDIPNIRAFYNEVFWYTFDYYNYVYGAKFRSTFEKVSSDCWVFAVWATKQSPQETPFMLKEPFLTSIGELGLSVGEAGHFYVACENGQYHDPNMNPFTEAIIAHAEDGYYVSSQRGIDLFKMHTKDGLSKQEWLNTLVNKNKNTEQLRSDQWRDVMQCNAVLFDHDTKFSIFARITHVSKYIDQIKGYFMDFVSVDKEYEDDMMLLFIRDVDFFWNLWGVLNHTLDLWVSYTPADSDQSEYSLISNIYQHDTDFYIENSHITYFPADGTPYLEPGRKVLAVIPRDGIDWRMVGVNSLSQDYDRKFTFIPQPINGKVELKGYLG